MRKNRWFCVLYMKWSAKNPWELIESLYILTVLALWVHMPRHHIVYHEVHPTENSEQNIL